MELDNPRNPSNPWKVVECKQTMEDRAKSTGQSKEDVAKEVSKAAQTVYTKSDAAKKHKTVKDGSRRRESKSTGESESLSCLRMLLGFLFIVGMLFFFLPSILRSYAFDQSTIYICAMLIQPKGPG